MKESTRAKIDIAYKNLIQQGITPSVRKLAQEANISVNTAREYLNLLKTDTPKTDTPKTDTSKTDTPKTDTSKTDTPKTDTSKTGTSKTDTSINKMLAETKLTPSTSFRSPEEVNQLANYLLNEKKEVTEEEIFTRYAENGELDAFIAEMNYIRRNIGKLFLKCKPLLIQLIEPFPSEYKEKALKELNRPVQN